MVIKNKVLFMNSSLLCLLSCRNSCAVLLAFDNLYFATARDSCVERINKERHQPCRRSDLDVSLSKHAAFLPCTSNELATPSSLST